MSASTAIGLVSATLREFLLDHMRLTPAVPVTVLAPDEVGGDRRINLFLYKVQENPALRNLDWQVVDTDPGRLRPPPLSLDLHYMLTAYAPNDDLDGNAAAHALLGEAMRVLHDSGELPTDDLPPGLAGARERFRIVPGHLDLDEVSTLWSTFGKPFRTSVLYEVSVVQLDAAPALERVRPGPVRRIGVPDVRAPWTPPRIDAVDPASGPAGRVLTVSGRHLAGWQATVALSGEPLLTSAALTEDTLAVPLPAGLPPGFYELWVDVARLSRQTFVVEVTP